MIAVPPWLITVTQRIAKETTLFLAPINHILVNEYLPGQGIMPHQDGPLYHPVVAILSLGSPALMHFTPHARILGITQEGTSRLADKPRFALCSGNRHRRQTSMLGYIILNQKNPH
jgi:alkylated DNA repair protein alkB family protein 6